MSKAEVIRKAPVRAPLSLDKAAKVVARSLGMSQDELIQSFRPATWLDLPQILALRQAVLAHDITWDDAAYLSWRYRLSRPGEGAGECWVLMRGNELIGMIGTEDLTLAVDGVSVDGLRVMDILVPPNMEGKGLGPWLGLTMQSKSVFVLAVGANANSKRMVERTFEARPNRRTFIHPIGFDHFMAKRLKWPPLAKVAATLADWAMVAGRVWLLGHGLNGITTRKLDHLPDDLPLLLMKSTRPDRVEVVRSMASLNWRLRTPRARFDIWGAWHQGELVGLMVTRPDKQDDGYHSWMIMDVILNEGMKPTVLKALLRRVIGAARAQNAVYLSIVSYRHDLERLLSKVAFVEQTWHYRILAWSCTDDVLRDHVNAGADWSFNEVHSDGG